MKRIHIIDYDGTLYDGNSFRDWIAYLFLKGLVTGRIRLSWLILIASIKRLARQIDHAAMKQAVLLAWARCGPASSDRLLWLEAFGRRQLRKVRTGLLAEIAASGGVTVLATAAPADYLEPVRDALGIDFVAATKSPEGDPSWKENIGPAKKARLSALFGKQDLLPAHCILYSDHRDDFPVFDLAQEVVLFGQLATEEASTGSVSRGFPNIAVRVWESEASPLAPAFEPPTKDESPLAPH